MTKSRMKKAINVYVLDTSAFLALIEEEAGFGVVEDLLRQAEANKIIIFVSFMTFMEIYYITLRERDEFEARERLKFMNFLPIIRVDSTESQGIVAGYFKAKYNISNADAWISALAKEQNAVLVHKDPEFEKLEAEIKFLKLPYKK